MKRWRVAAGASLGLAVGWGPFFVLSFGLFQKPIIAELGWSRTQISFGFSVATIVAALITTVIGALIDVYGVRKITLIGTVAFPLALGSLGLVHNYSGYLACAVALGLMGPWTSYPAYLPVLPIWFKRNLGAAFAFASSGIGLGTAVATLCAGSLIVRLGWRHAIMAIAALLLVVGVGNVFVMLPGHRETPAQDAAMPERADSSLLFHKAIRTPVFWKLSICFALVTLVGVGMNFHLAALLTDRGFSTLQAAGIASLVGSSILIARLITEILLDHIEFKIIALVIFLGQAAALLLLASDSRGLAPYVAACLIGIAIGGEGDLMPYAFSKQFGTQAYGKIYGFRAFSDQTESLGIPARWII